MAKANYVQPGNCIDYTNSGSDKIAAGDIVSLTTRIAVAAADIKAGEVGAVMTEGVFELPLTASTAVTLGAAVYYVASTGKVTTTATDNIPCGWCVKAAASGDATVKVKIG